MIVVNALRVDQPISDQGRDDYTLSIWRMQGLTKAGGLARCRWQPESEPSTSLEAADSQRSMNANKEPSYEHCLRNRTRARRKRRARDGSAADVCSNDAAGWVLFDWGDTLMSESALLKGAEKAAALERVKQNQARGPRLVKKQLVDYWLASSPAQRVSASSPSSLPFCSASSLQSGSCPAQRNAGRRSKRRRCQRPVHRRDVSEPPPCT